MATAEQTAPASNFKKWFSMSRMSRAERRLSLAVFVISFAAALGPLSRCSTGPLAAAGTVGAEYNSTLGSGIVPQWSAWMNPFGVIVLQNFDRMLPFSMQSYRFMHSLGWSAASVLIFFIVGFGIWCSFLYPLIWLWPSRRIKTRLHWFLHRLVPFVTPILMYAAILYFYFDLHSDAIHRTEMLKFNIYSLSSPVFTAKPPVADAITTGPTVVIKDYSKISVPSIDFNRYWMDPQREHLALLKYRSTLAECQAEAYRVAAESGIRREEIDRLFTVALDYERQYSSRTFMIPIRFELWNRQGTEYWICEWGWEHSRMLKDQYAVPMHVQIFAIRRRGYQLAGWETCM